MRYITIIFGLLLSFLPASAYNPFWTYIDKKAITALVLLDKNDPLKIEQYFIPKEKKKGDIRKEDLGFGWSMWKPGIGGGYIALSATFYYYQDSIVSYSLTPELPEEKGLIKRYKKWYNHFFEYSDSSIIEYHFNEDAILHPLKEYNKGLKQVPAYIRQYMTPPIRNDVRLCRRRCYHAKQVGFSCHQRQSDQ